MKKKIEISAGGIVYKKNGNDLMWLVIQHSQHKGWTFPKGLVADKNQDEGKEEAALREVEEEGGIKAKIVYHQPIEVKYFYRFKGSPHGQNAKEDFLVDKTVYYYLMEYLSGDPKDHDWEVSQAKFLKEAEVKKILSFDSDKKAFDTALKIISSLKKIHQ